MRSRCCLRTPVPLRSSAMMCCPLAGRGLRRGLVASDLRDVALDGLAGVGGLAFAGVEVTGGPAVAVAVRGAQVRFLLEQLSERGLQGVLVDLAVVVVDVV